MRRPSSVATHAETSSARMLAAIIVRIASTRTCVKRADASATTSAVCAGIACAALRYAPNVFFPDTSPAAACARLPLATSAISRAKNESMRSIGRADAVDRSLQLRVLRIVGRDVREILRQRRAPLAIAVEEQRLAGRDVAAHGGLFVEQFGEDVARGGVERVRRFDARRLALHGVHLQDRDAGDDGEQDEDEGEPGADLAADAEGHDGCPC